MTLEETKEQEAMFIIFNMTLPFFFPQVLDSQSFTAAPVQRYSY